MDLKTKYKNDMESFMYKVIEKVKSSPKENASTISDISENMMSISTDGYTGEKTRYFHDIEGGVYIEDKFNTEQIKVLDYIVSKNESFTFLSYPDIPADCMKILAKFALDNNKAKNRIGLWKISRSGIYDAKALQVVLILFLEGRCLPDEIVFNKTIISCLNEAYDYVIKKVNESDKQNLIDLYYINPNVSLFLKEFMQKNKRF